MRAQSLSASSRGRIQARHSARQPKRCDRLGPTCLCCRAVGGLCTFQIRFARLCDLGNASSTAPRLLRCVQTTKGSATAQLTSKQIVQRSAVSEDPGAGRSTKKALIALGVFLLGSSPSTSLALSRRYMWAMSALATMFLRPCAAPAACIAGVLRVHLPGHGDPCLLTHRWASRCTTPSSC